jgi:hypothetical protein
LNAKDLEIAITQYCLQEVHHDLVVPRCESLGFEADILSVTKTAFLHEFEIKMSRGDFVIDKHKKKWQFYEKIGSHCPNYFWYVCPEDLIKVEELKDYQGLIYCKNNKLTPIKYPTRIGKQKCNKKVWIKMIRSLSYKLLNESIKLRSEKKENKNLVLKLQESNENSTR